MAGGDQNAIDIVLGLVGVLMVNAAIVALAWAPADGLVTTFIGTLAGLVVLIALAFAAARAVRRRRFGDTQSGLTWVGAASATLAAMIGTDALLVLVFTGVSWGRGTLIASLIALLGLGTCGWILARYLSRATIE